MLPPKGAGSCRHLWGLGLTEGRSFLFVLWVVVSLGAELPAMLHQGGVGLKLTLQVPPPSEETMWRSLSPHFEGPAV